MEEFVNSEIEVIESDFQRTKTPSFTQQIIYDENGDVVSNKFWKGTPNGKGWVMMYTEKVADLVVKCPSASTLKVFMLIAMEQKYDERGYATTKKAIQERLGIDKSTCLAAFKWLKDNFILNESRINGCSEFMINPDYVTVGRDKKKRIKEWLRRWQGQTVATLPLERVHHELRTAKPPRHSAERKSGWSKRSMSMD